MKIPAKSIVRYSLIALIIGSLLGLSLAHGFSLTFLKLHADLEANQTLPPQNLSEILLALTPQPFGTSSPLPCTLTMMKDSLGDARRGRRVTRYYDCYANVQIGAAAEVLEWADLPSTLLPLTIAAEIGHRFVPRAILVDLFTERYVQDRDLRSRARDQLGIELDQASPRELLWLMASADTEYRCKDLANQDVVRLDPVPTCREVIEERFTELAREAGISRLERTEDLPLPGNSS